MRKGIISVILIFSLIINVLINANIVYAAGKTQSENVEIATNGTYTISESKPVHIAEGLSDVKLIMKGVTIQTSDNGVAPIEIGSGSSVSIELQGDNVVNSSYSAAAIQVDEGASVIISGRGSLKASGGQYAAAIGSIRDGKSGDIEITDGTIIAVAGEKSAGIGGGYNGSCSNIVISGGTVNTTGSGGGAGVGGGFGGNSESIRISGGTVWSKGMGGGAGIGGGYRGLGGSIDISNGDVIAISDGYGFGIGCGRYASGSNISISDSANVAAFTKDNTAGIEIGNVSSGVTAIFTGVFEQEYFDTDKELTFSGSSQKTITLPHGSEVFSTNLASKGVYTISADGNKLSYRNNSNYLEEFSVDETFKSYDLRLNCNCSLTELSASVNNVMLSENQTNASARVTVSGGKLNLWKGCTIHTGQSNSTEYSYDIIKDDAKLVTNADSITNGNISLNVENSGAYEVGVKVTATDKAGILSRSKDVYFSVIKQGEEYSVAERNILIDQNGTYTITGSTTQNSIEIAPNLDDVSLIFSSVKIDLTQITLKKSPLLIGSGSKVSITLRGTSNFFSNKEGDPIVLEQGTPDDHTVLKINGSGVLNAEDKDKGSAIGSSDGSANTDIYILEGTINAEATNGAAIGSSNASSLGSVFISDKVELSAFTGSKNIRAIEGTISEGSYNGYTQAYVLQANLEESFKNSTDITIRKRSTSSNDARVDDFKAGYLGFAALMPYENIQNADDEEDNIYKISYYQEGVGNRYFTRGTSKEYGYDYFELSGITNHFSMYYDKCSCKISAPTSQVEKITLPYDVDTKSILLSASGSKLTIDKDCDVHSENDSIRYSFNISEDKDDIANITGNNLKVSARDEGKYTIKVKVTASSRNLSASKEISVSVSKLSKDETDKLLGKRHYAYISGDGDHLFRPDEFITRAEVSAMISKASEDFDENSSYSVNFDDVIKGDWYNNYVGYMYDSNIITGYEDNTFRPDENMTRAEFTATVCRMIGLAEDISKGKLKDVEGHWANGYVNAMYKKKYVKGYENGTFDPDGLITRAEAVAILNRSLDRSANAKKIDTSNVVIPFKDVTKEHWAYYEIIEATNTHYAKEMH